ncbi:Gfo/Idh/MocA family protein [Fimbriimonas ginsengisoli]|uniref:NADH-dependent dehydrogenase n=1 Tax=Fimbriimonas ginsengisoli Gsoil 348 TaxID=661478 RepID=A0A068NZ15_FIMGI|nr:Gfo/Idh/MocA family oxidoreductase [Fimbriimonas ginsengisoli]AIE87784.1 NADH-dependent dehydrogenase [Fimbriimonas ginsengisoli Gsoil 348]
MGKLRIGIVGRRGTAHVAGFRAHPSAEVVAICDLDPRRVESEAAAHDIPLRFTSFDEMLERVDAVFVATPMQLHAEQVVQSLGAGKHVLSEVTACVSLEECWAIRDAVLASGKTYMMAENYGYRREAVLVCEMARHGLFGELYYGEGEYLHDMKPYHHLADGTPSWRYRWQVGQPGNTYPTHSLGPVMQWFKAVDPSERVESVLCVGSGRYSDPEHPHDDTTNTLLRLSSGKQIRLRLDMMSNRPHQMTYYALQGTHGVYEASRQQGGPSQVWIGKNPPPGPVKDEHREWRPLSDFEALLPDWWLDLSTEAERSGHGGGDFFVAYSFVDAVVEQRPASIDLYDGLEWTAAGLCSQISIARGGEWIKLPDFRSQAA